jgi:oxepin-CoA hydrolase/3-oxo-5,6-dehydrosuberyl-CoA semialdehyde dehydrogenase
MFVRDAAKEMTQKTGQKCTAVRRIFVPPARVDDVIGALGEALSAIRVGNPALDEVRMGPLATAQQLRDYRDGVGKLEASGARVAHGSKTEVEAVGVSAGKGYFVAPLLLAADHPRDARAVHEHEVFGPCATVMPYASADDAAEMVGLGEGGLVSSVYTDDREIAERLVLGIAPFHGRVLLGSKKVADQAISPGIVLPSCVHGGPGRAGGGEELGGERGMAFYTQRTAIQGDRAILDKMLGAEK